MKNILLTICLCLIPFLSVGQEEIQGRITNTTDVAGIHILNKNSRYNTITDHRGNFSIRAHVWDTLVFSSIHYMPKKVVVNPEIYESKVVIVSLQELVNELDEVFIGPSLTGNISSDLKNIKTTKPLNFDDVGIPGFKGKPEEKIAPIAPVIPVSVNLEALYKHLSGYYRKLRLRRKWEAQNITVSKILFVYDATFFKESYQIPENRIFDFLLFCIETSSIQEDFKKENYVGVLSIFEEKSLIYLNRLSQKKE